MDKVVKKKVTVLLPVYNSEKFLKYSIDSILSQTHRNLEILIIDDGSTDKSLEVLKKYSDSRIKLITHTANKGLVFSLNEGLKLAKGEYIARMDSDDISLPDRIEKQLVYMEKHQVDIVGTAAYKVDSDGNINGSMRPLLGTLLKIYFWRPSPLIHPTVMMKNSHTLKYFEKYKSAEDYELWLRMSKYKQIANMRDKLLYYRVHEGGVSVRNREQQLTSSCNAFNDNFGLSIDLKTFLSICSLDFSINPIRRQKYFNKVLVSKIKFSLLMQILDFVLYSSKWIIKIIKIS